MHAKNTLRIRGLSRTCFGPCPARTHFPFGFVDLVGNGIALPDTHRHRTRKLRTIMRHCATRDGVRREMVPTRNDVGQRRMRAGPLGALVPPRSFQRLMQNVMESLERECRAGGIRVKHAGFSNRWPRSIEVDGISGNTRFQSMGRTVTCTGMRVPGCSRVWVA